MARASRALTFVNAPVHAHVPTVSAIFEVNESYLLDMSLDVIDFPHYPVRPVHKAQCTNDNRIDILYVIVKRTV